MAKYMVGSTFDGTLRAAEARDVIHQLDEQLDQLRLGNIAVISKDSDGQYSIDESASERIVKPSKNFGAWLGALFGTLSLPLTGVGGIAQAAPVGAMYGEEVAERVDVGFRDEELQQVAAALESSHSLLLALVEEGDAQPVLKQLEQLGGTTFQLLVEAGSSEDVRRVIDQVKHAQE